MCLVCVILLLLLVYFYFRIVKLIINLYFIYSFANFSVLSKWDKDVKSENVQVPLAIDIDDSQFLLTLLIEILKIY